MIVCCRWEQPAQIIKVKWSHYTWICPEMGSASILINNRILSHLFLGVSRHPTKLSLDLDGISQLSRSLRIPCLQKFTRDMIQRRTVRAICASCGQCGVWDFKLHRWNMLSMIFFGVPNISKYVHAIYCTECTEPLQVEAGN